MITKRLIDYVKAGSRFWIQRSSHQPFNAPPVHDHDFIEMVYVVSGDGRHEIGGKAYPLRAGEFFMIGPGEPHRYLPTEDSGLEIINCMFDAGFVLPAIPQDFPAAHLRYTAPLYDREISFVQQLSLNSAESTALLRLLEDMLLETRRREPGCEIVIRNKLLEILIQLSRYWASRERGDEKDATAPGGHEIMVRRMCTYLERNYMQKITVPLLSEQFNMSERHINRLFRKELGLSVTEVLRRIRIERAKQLLLETNRSVEAVAVSVGFEDSSFFSRMFCREVGSTPGKYRRTNRLRRAGG